MTAAEPGRALVVKLEEGLHPVRINVLFDLIQRFPGVVSVTDLAAISADTLDLLLHGPSPEDRKPRSRKKVLPRTPPPMFAEVEVA
jgi:hypothetical protein